MAEAAVAETETSTPVTEAPELIADNTAELPADPVVETPETAPEVPARTPDSYTLAELDALYRDAKLSDPALVQRREALRQSEYDRQQNERRQLEEWQRNEREQLQQLQSASSDVRQSIAQSIAAEVNAAYSRGREPDLALIQERIHNALTSYETRSRDIHIGPYEVQLRKVLAQHYPGASNVQKLAKMALPELMSQVYQLGRAHGVDADTVAMSKKDFDAALAKAKKDGYDSFKADNPGAAPPPASGPRQAPATRLTLEQIDAMPTAEWMSYSKEAREQMLARARGM